MSVSLSAPLLTTMSATQAAPLLLAAVLAAALVRVCASSLKDLRRGPRVASSSSSSALLLAVLGASSMSSSSSSLRSAGTLPRPLSGCGLRPCGGAAGGCRGAGGGGACTMPLSAHLQPSARVPRLPAKGMPAARSMSARPLHEATRRDERNSRRNAEVRSSVFTPSSRSPSSSSRARYFLPDERF